MLSKLIFFLSETGIPREETTIGKMFTSWESAGFFTYLIPFLIIFSLLYGILSKAKMFGEDSKKINALISLAIGLLAIQFSFVSEFFDALFPRFAVAIAIILVGMLTLGLFMEEKHKGSMLYVGIGIFTIVLITTFIDLGIGTDINFSEYIPMVMLAILLIGGIVLVVKGKKSGKKEKKPEEKKPEKKE